jgi:serine/threonine protein kinase
MSPEQATGDARVGASTDIYALGCVLYEMLVGEPPYTGKGSGSTLTVGAPRRVFNDSLYRREGVGTANYDISRRGDRFVMVEDAAPANAPAAGRLYVVLNWFEDLRGRMSR